MKKRAIRVFLAAAVFLIVRDLSQAQSLTDSLASASAFSLSAIPYDPAAKGLGIFRGSAAICIV